LQQEGFLFKGIRLCTPKYSTYEILIGEVHRGSLAGHNGENKTISMIREHHYWPRIGNDV